MRGKQTASPLVVLATPATSLVQLGASGGLSLASHIQLIASGSSVPCSVPSLPCFLPDTMVCTGCCSCLDHRDIPLQAAFTEHQEEDDALTQESDRFLHIMQQHPEMIQQVRSVRGRRRPGRENLSEREAQQDKELHQNLIWLMLPRRI